MPTVNYDIGASADDAFEYGDNLGSPTAGGQDLRIYSYSDDSHANYRAGGFRWDGVAVPNGATITSAYINLWGSDAGYVNMNVDIYFHDADDPANFSNNSNIIRVANRPRTTASAAWVAGINNGQMNQSPDIATVVQEIVDRGGWATGQAMVALLIPNTDQTLRSRIAAYDNGQAAQRAELYITYTTSSSSSSSLSSSSSSSSSQSSSSSSSTARSHEAQFVVAQGRTDFIIDEE